MKLARWAIVVAFGTLLVASGQAAAQCGGTPCELSVVATPERQDVLYPFAAVIRVTVTNASTGAPVGGVQVSLQAVYRTYLFPTDPGCEVDQSASITRWKKTSSKGTASFSIKTGFQWIGADPQECPDIHVHIRARKRGFEGADCETDVDVVDCEACHFADRK